MNGTILLVHLVGLALSLGAAAVKLSLLLACRRDPSLAAAYVRVARPVTRLIVAGIALLTLSGAAWLALGHPFTPWLVAKLGLVAAVWVIGPYIDKVVEPAFVRAAPAAGAAATAGFAVIQRRHLALEIVATGLLCAITFLGVMV
jgi:uncharacterized membrane protein SirB2